MPAELPEKLTDLCLQIGGITQAQLAKRSVYHLVYEAQARHIVGLGLPIEDKAFQDGDLFAALDMNLPEGYLFERIVDRYPKFPLSKMHLLALMGAGGIGRVAYVQPGDAGPVPPAAGISRDDLLCGTKSKDLFEELVNAYLGPGSALSGVQPKVMVPVTSKAIIPIPNAIVKTEGPRYPGLAANEWLCLSAAAHAGLAVPRFDLSQDGQLLVLDRFDIEPSGQRLGFEDMAAIMQLRVRDRLSSRKYIGSYEDITTALRLVCTDVASALHQFFQYLVLTVLVRNGDAHLKNFAVLYNDAAPTSAAPTAAPASTSTHVWLAPLFDQVTTTLYTYQRPGGVETVDNTMALKLRRGQRSGDKSKARSYPSRKQLEAFGREVCGVYNPSAIIDHIAQAQSQALQSARGHAAVNPELLARITQVWDDARLGY
jgi:serine/threonine-protein kinase HipA